MRKHLLDIEDYDDQALDRAWGFADAQLGNEDGSLHPLLRRWLLRTLALVKPQQWAPLWEADNKAQLLMDLGVLRPSDLRPGNIGSIGARVSQRLRKALAECARAPTAALPAHLASNTEKLAELIGLSPVERLVLAFAVSLHGNACLRAATDALGDNLASSMVVACVARIIDAPETDVRAALGLQSALSRAGLVKLDRDGSCELRGKLKVLSADFIDAMRFPSMEPADLLRGVVGIASKAELTLADYAHIASSLGVLRPYLDRALASVRSGVNVLVYGAPGTGKSQLVRVLAEALGSTLYEVACDDEDGDPIEGQERLCAAAAAQCFFAQQRALLVLDEAEDIFDDGGSFGVGKSTAQRRKAWVNRFLESNRLPTLWLANTVDCLDPAFVRRFDQVIELRVPPQRQREGIIRQACGGMLDDKAVARFAESEHLAPAVVTRVAAVVDTIQDRLDKQQASAALELLVNQTLQAQGLPKLPSAASQDTGTAYDPTLLHANVDLAQVTEGLRRTGRGRLCLYGPPGTGKSAWVRWLANQLGLPLRVKRASDLLSMYVGGTERALAEAFANARDDGAILLLDEVDSFLQDRRNAQHSWETTQVNEMLTQMEAFPGIFVATTNLMDNLDAASLRRFDLKAKFDYLTTEQAWLMLQWQCEALGLAVPSPELKARLARLERLTPGDFALVVRQAGFRELGGAADVVRELEVEVRLKGGAKRQVGF